jgi:hypothetical protein
MRCLSFLALLLSLLAVTVPARASDTGSYRILDYEVMLTPRTDGIVTIDYYQKWQVTGGHVPWITVGLPSRTYTITSFRGAIGEIAPANQDGWSGVRIDLDRDYLPGQVFEVAFSVDQRRLFYARGSDYRLDFTPCWYDRAEIDSLTVRLQSPVALETLSTHPRATSVAGDVLTWTKTGLASGERFAISASFPKAALPAALPEGNLRASGSVNQTDARAYFAGLLVVAYIALRLLIHLFFGGYSGGRFLSGMGGFSCACACVSCACACACAGGGGAGCTRKRTTHSCPVCRAREAERAQTR